MDNQNPPQDNSSANTPPSASPVPTAQFIQPPVTLPGSPPTKSKKKFFIAGILFLLILLGGGYYVMNQSQTKPLRPTPTPVIAPPTATDIPSPTSEASPTASLSGKKQSCPQEWIQNMMPGVVEESSTSAQPKSPGEYFIVDGKRVEMSEYDLDWVKKNCALTPQKVY